MKHFLFLFMLDVCYPLGLHWLYTKSIDSQENSKSHFDFSTPVFLHLSRKKCIFARYGYCDYNYNVVVMES